MIIVEKMDDVVFGLFISIHMIIIQLPYLDIVITTKKYWGD